MIRSVFLAATFGVVAACAPLPPPPPAPPPAPVAEAPAESPSACGLERFEFLIGQPEAAIPTGDLPPGARVICATCMVTQDFRADRLNITLSADGRVAGLRCG